MMKMKRGRMRRESQRRRNQKKTAWDQKAKSKIQMPLLRIGNFRNIESLVNVSSCLLVPLKY